jgi:hypothetical protein
MQKIDTENGRWYTLCDSKTGRYGAGWRSTGDFALLLMLEGLFALPGVGSIVYPDGMQGSMRGLEHVLDEISG